MTTKPTPTEFENGSKITWNDNGEKPFRGTGPIKPENTIDQWYERMCFTLIGIGIVLVLVVGIYFGVPMSKFIWDYARMFWFWTPL